MSFLIGYIIRSILWYYGNLYYYWRKRIMEEYFKFRFVVEIVELILAGLGIIGCIIYSIYSYFKYKEEKK